MQPEAIFALARDITVTGGVLFILYASYSGKFMWKWQHDAEMAAQKEFAAKLELEKDKLLAKQVADTEYWREIAETALNLGGDLARERLARTR